MASVGMIERGDCSGLPLESFTKALGRNFDCHIAAQPGIARLIHLTHTTSADLRHQFIWSEFFTWGKSHIWRSSLYQHQAPPKEWLVSRSRLSLSRFRLWLRIGRYKAY